MTILGAYDIMKQTRGIPMNFSHTYVKELELLILETLLPTYEKYQKSIGINNPLTDINPDLLKQIKPKKKLPALLRAKEK